MDTSSRNPVLILSVVGVIFSIYLVITDIQTNGYCPKVTFIPACYLVMIAFVLIILSEFLRELPRDIIFYIGWLIGLPLAVWFSYNQLSGLENCPRLFGVPMCFLSFGVFLILIFLKIKDR